MRDIQIGDIEAVSPQAWAIRGVLGGLSVVWGPTGNYKTFLAIGMSICVAAGKPWFGCSVKQGPVLYILGEGGLDLFRRRAGEAARYFGIKDMTGLPLWVRGEALDLSKPFLMGPQFEAWDAISPRLVVIDTLSRCLPGDENKQEVMQGFVSSMDTFRDRYDCTVLALHHAGKAGDVRGSTVLPGAVDVSIYVQKAKEGIENILTVRPDKLRDLDTEAFANTKLYARGVDVRNSMGNLVLDEYGDKVTTLVIQTNEDHKDIADKAYATFHVLHKPGQWVGFREWHGRSGMNVDIFKKALNHLLLDRKTYDIFSPELGQYALVSEFFDLANPLERFTVRGDNFDVEETIEAQRKVDEHAPYMEED